MMKTHPKTHRKQHPGRRTKARIFDSMTSAAGALKLPLAVLRQAKLAGCEAFRHSRVHEAPLLAWLEKNRIELAGAEPRDLAGARLQEILERTRRTRLSNDERERALVRRDDVANHICSFFGAQKGLLRQLLENELPSELAGLDAAHIRVRLKKAVDDICAGCQGIIERWTI